MQYLLLSNSSMPGQAYLEWPKSHIKAFLGKKKHNLIFIPFAGVTFSYDEYHKTVAEVFTLMGFELHSIHTIENKKDAIDQADGIVIGGGNSFHLLFMLYQFDLLDIIREKVKNGIPYIGWSAGSNIAGPTIKTTNDMPIIEPPSFNSIGFFPFQINPHYTEKTIAGHGGESRQQRIMEFLEVNRDSKVVGLAEGTFIQLKNDQLSIGGLGGAKLFEWKKEPVDLPVGDKINRFISL